MNLFKGEGEFIKFNLTRDINFICGMMEIFVAFFLYIEHTQEKQRHGYKLKFIVIVRSCVRKA
jgi:hypothetical protein